MLNLWKENWGFLVASNSPKTPSKNPNVLSNRKVLVVSNEKRREGLTLFIF